MLSYSSMSATAASLCLLCSMVLPFGVSMLGGGGIAPITCCSTVSITNTRCDLCAGAGSRVERYYMYTVIRPYAMHCAPDQGWRMGVASVYYAAVKAGGWRAESRVSGR